MVHGEVNGSHWLERWAARTPPDLVIANSRFTADSSARLFSHSPVEFVYPPVAAEVAGERTTQRQRLRSDLATPGEATVILMVSRIEPLKGHRVLLDALARLREIPNWRCWIVGGAQRPAEESLLAELQRHTERHSLADHVRFVGQRSDVSALMAAADIYCQPNVGPEGFGLTFIEALRAGLPVVTSNIGGAAETVDASCGVLTPPGDATAVADALRALMGDRERRATLGAAGPARVAELCDPRQQLLWLAASLNPRTHERRVVGARA
jgi:glycosyltransferase involved in cell wall biosynthesis